MIRNRSVSEFYHIREPSCSGCPSGKLSLVGIVTNNPTSRLFTVLVTQRIAIWPHPVTELDHRESSYSNRIMKLANSLSKNRRPFEYIKPTSYTLSIPFLSLLITTNKIIDLPSFLSTTPHYPVYCPQNIHPQPLHSLL